MSKTATVAKHETLADFPEYRTAEAKVSELREHLRACQAERHTAEQNTGGIAEEAVALLSGGGIAPTVAELRHKTAVAEKAVQLAESDFLQVTIGCGGILAEENQGERTELCERIENAVAELADAMREYENFVGRFHFGGHSMFQRPTLANHPHL